MKKTITIIAVMAVVVIFGGLFVIQNVNLNKFGTEKYYVQTKGEPDDSGQYTLPGYDKNGKEKTLTFMKAGEDHKFKENAYLCVYVKAEKGVTSYEEVKKEDIPDKAKEKLQ
ncbi:YxeA family protein [Aneurinibacillus aneurinilyticus]|uniref:YxeA family protein n=1 Tax=Aneurinibacillus aneurinilyticus TaxID=1391 RepID=UPI002E1E3026|nr:YxeA family protein [Aneurinibacillus aneurinilyticus]